MIRIHSCSSLRLSSLRGLDEFKVSVQGSLVCEMDAEEASPTAEELELKEFNDPFEVVSETFVRQRRQEVDAEPISKEDDDLLTQMLDAMPIEDSLIHDAFSKMVNMNLVSSEIATQVQEDFDFEKVQLNLRFRPPNATSNGPTGATRSLPLFSILLSLND